MNRVFDSFLNTYDYRILLLGIGVCVLSAIGVIATGRRAMGAAKSVRAKWIIAAGLATGVGTWGASFVLIAGFKAPVPMEYDLPEIVMTLAGMVLTGTVCWALIARSRRSFMPAIGGTILGASLAVLYFSVFDSVYQNADIEISTSMAVVSVVLAALGAAFAGIAGFRIRRAIGNVVAALCFTTGLMGQHILATQSLVLTLEDPGAVHSMILPPETVGLIVALSILPVIGLLLVMAVFDTRMGRRRAAEVARMAALSNATSEGVAIVRDGMIVEVNNRLCELLKLRRGDLTNMPLSKVGLDATAAKALSEVSHAESRSCQLRSRIGAPITAQVTVRRMDYNGQPARIYAFRDVSAEERARAKILHMAHHDTLTGLPNRLCFRSKLEVALGEAWDDHSEVALMFFDLDRFKEVNDVHGHATGDALLVAVAERMLDSLPRQAVAARLSGDEFAVILPGVDRLEAMTIGQRVVNNVGSPLMVGHVNINVSASGGVSMFPLDGEDPDRLMNQADLALYRAKHMGRNCVCEFDPELGRMMQDKRLLEADLATAIEDDLLDLHFQPQARLGCGDVTGFEALVRWHDEQRGFVSPGEFVQLAEESGQILRMGQWVIEEACREAVSWPGGQRVTVNVSPAQFKQGNLVHTVDRALRVSGLDPARLEIEITEGVLIDDRKRAIDLLTRLKSLGVGLAIDDFGTGYSSLNYLRAFPFDKIKIDRSFISNIQEDREAQIIVRSTIDLAQKLGMGVVVEGVETVDELREFAELPSLTIQGYLLARPMSRGQISSFLQTAPDLSQYLIDDDSEFIGQGVA